MPDPVRTAHSRVALATRYNSPNLPSARQELTAAKLERAIREAIAVAPPLSDAQRVRLSRLLASGGTTK